MKITSMADVEAYLQALPARPHEYKRRLAHIKEVLAFLGEPQNSAPAIHIAGTSGKGSTAYYASAILTQSHYKVGLIVSPHVHTVKERAQIDGRPLSDTEYITHFTRFIDAVKNFELTYTEFVTVFAYWLFAELRVDYMVVEVGRGGRLDPTNAISRQKTVRGITDIGFDHIDLLGNTLVAIASEKAGIIRSGDSVLMNKQPPEIMDVIRQKAVDTQAHFIVAAQHHSSWLGDLPLYQQRNWQLASQAVHERLTLDHKPLPSDEALQSSLAISIPGRFEQRTYGGVELILDAAHNPQKIKALTTSLLQYAPDKKPVAVVALGKNKSASARELLSLLEPATSHIVTTEFHIDFSDGHDALPANTLADHLTRKDAVTVEPDLRKALRRAVQRAAQVRTYVLITGSFFLLDNVYPLLAELEASCNMH